MVSWNGFWRTNQPNCSLHHIVTNRTRMSFIAYQYRITDNYTTLNVLYANVQWKWIGLSLHWLYVLLAPKIHCFIILDWVMYGYTISEWAEQKYKESPISVLTHGSKIKWIFVLRSVSYLSVWNSWKLLWGMFCNVHAVVKQYPVSLDNVFG